MKITLRLLALALLLPAALSAQASTVVSGGFTSPLVVSSYTMPNGNSGFWRYLDYVYPDADNLTDNGLLSGGTGLLTNGLIAPGNWGTTGLPGGGPQGHYVGWTLNPTITFFFSQAVTISNVRVHFDIDNSGGTAAPGATTIDGTTYATTIPGGTAPFWADYALTTTQSATFATIGFTRTNNFIMISEVQFDGRASVVTTPEPASMALLATGLVALFGVARRRERSGCEDVRM